MSWEIFKSNILRKTNPSSGENSIDDIANIWATEYDNAVKRGKDTVNLAAIQTGNVSVMESLFKLALLQGQNSPSSTFSLVSEFGNGVKAYWTGAQMNPFPIPLIPSPGSIQNISVTSNIALNPGTWPIYPPLKPARKQETMVNMFILAAVVHLFSVGGIIQTTSLYPSAPTPVPGPGIINWTGYLIPPVIPIPNINFPSQNGSEPPVINQPDGTDGFILSSNGLTDQATDQATDQTNILDGDTSLDNIINTTIPRDVIDPIESEEIMKDFKQQLEMGGTKCG